MNREQLKEKTGQIDRIIDKYLPDPEGPAGVVFEAMNYSIHVGGKRLRPMLMMETFSLFGGEHAEAVLYPFMAAIEMIHTYSLCHDDLPAMDNDSMRRGKPSTHAKYGEAMGILAGDGLLNYAFETALRAFDACDKLAADEAYELMKRIRKALAVLAKKAGIYGMIGGQTVDIISENDPGSVTMDTIKFIHENKTAAMLESSMMTGAILAGAGPEDTEAIERIASDVGLAFQITDDILDVEGDEKVLGKTTGKDEKSGKATYVSLAGIDKAKEDVRNITDRAVRELERVSSCTGADGTFLKELIESLVDRDR